MTNGDFDIQGHFRTGARHPLLNISGCPGTRGTRTGAAPGRSSAAFNNICFDFSLEIEPAETLPEPKTV